MTTSELRAERDEVLEDEPGREGRKRRPLLTGLIAFGALAGFAVAVGYAYQKGREAGLSSVAPIITAGPGPYKVKPEDPGGMAVPYRNMEVYGRLAGSPPSPPLRETLLPPPEQLMAPPRPAPAETVSPPGWTSAPDAPPKAVATPQVAPPPPIAPHAAPPAKTIAEAAQGAANGHKVTPGSAKPEATPPAAKAALTAGGAYRVQLGAVRSADQARGAWSRLQKSHSDLLGSLALSVDRKDMGTGKGVFFRMQAGPLANETDARGLCTRLKQRKVDCLVVGL